VNNAVSGQKCRQIVSGAIYVDDPLVQGRTQTRKTVLIHDAKFELLDEMLEELNGKPLMVVFEFKHELERAQKRYNTKSYDLAHIDGSTTDKQTDQVINRWNRGLLDMVWVQPQSAAHGLNMQEMSPEDIFGFTFPWDYELYDQVIHRIWRSGNNAPQVRVHRPAAIDTVEERVLQVLGIKGGTQNRMTDALLLMAEERGITGESLRKKRRK